MALHHNDLDPNRSGYAYYGTTINNIEILDTVGINQPFVRKNETLISVSVSGYCALVRADIHPEIQEIADSLVEDKHAGIVKGFLHYQQGYNHSLTACHGFGPSRLLSRNVLSDIDLRDRNETNIAAVMHLQTDELLLGKCIDAKAQFFEYCSLALHEFVAQIVPEMIVGWIASKRNAGVLKEKMEKNTIRKLPVWCVDDL